MQSLHSIGAQSVLGLCVLHPLPAVSREAFGPEATTTLVQEAQGRMGNVWAVWAPFQCAPRGGCSRALGH